MQTPIDPHPQASPKRDTVLTPSTITSWLGCAHSLTLHREVTLGRLSIAPGVLSELAEVLVEKGAEHERTCLEDYEAARRYVYQVPGRNANEPFDEWVARVDGSFDVGADVLYQMPLVHDGVRGIADFLVRNASATPEYGTYEPVDAKLTRSQAKPGHVLQLAFYAEALGARLGRVPQHMHLWLGSGATQSLLVEEFLPYWRRLRRQLRDVLDEDGSRADTYPQLCETCEYCAYYTHCEEQWRRDDSLTFVANSRHEDRERLVASGVRTMVELSTRRDPVEKMADEKLSRLSRQAALQVEARRHASAPPFEIIEAGDDPLYGHGFELMPEPDQGDVFFDFEGDPFWTPQHDLMFLAGLYYRNNAGEWEYDARWAHDLHEQQQMMRGLLEFFRERRLQYPGMHVYHYNHTERSSIERLMHENDDANLFASLADTGLFVDLFTIARNAVRVGTESYGLKHLEHLVNFVRDSGIDQGAGAVVEYEQWLQSHEPRLLNDIARYNRDDVAATKALRDWLVAQRPTSLPWREPIISPEVYEYDTDTLVESLHEFDDDSPEYLLGDLLNYWRREHSADMTPRFAALDGDPTDLFHHEEYLVGLSVVGFAEPRGRERLRSLVLRYPDQELNATLFASGTSVAFSSFDQRHATTTVRRLDPERHEIALTWGPWQEEVDVTPRNLTYFESYSPRAKLAALKDLARQVLDPVTHGEPSRLALSLLSRDRPRFRAGAGPRSGLFSDQLEEIYEWVGDLDESVVAFQGPPGTGKTYSGSHIIHDLITRGFRVGVVSTGHLTIDHLMEATYQVFREHGTEASLRALRWQSSTEHPLEFARYSNRRGDLADEGYNLIGGTSWLWASSELRQNPVDILVVDEAGQLSLADAVACTNGSRNMLLLGDPLQLAQVAKAVHPSGSGASVLEHILGGDATISARDGVFMSVTRRMHPDVCDFISRQIYEGRLTSHHSCARQTTHFGTGLRWLASRHENRSTESPEEATQVAEAIVRILGTEWVDHTGETRVLEAADVMVVAPYNDQVKLIRRHLTTIGLGAVRVGTVDKFQGREAPVVFFTMTTSSSADMPRGPEFLFSRNRLNVAVSRARCLAVLVCTEALLNSRANDLEGMRLISTLCAFVEYAERQFGGSGF